ncbi:MAG: type IV toxin-antitoxin system AbiEi family antitoxin [Epsilonproteobacteria bacterium]|nr:type IV toxin-antitoxin system AbiEi family antitoxin [Campylobacterota bacterium]
MSIEKEEKLKQLYELLPEGVVAPSSWLTIKGYSPQLLYKYVQSSWLDKIGRSAYIRPSSEVQWQGVVLGLQRLADEPFHVGGLTALNLQGFAHYLAIGGEKKVMLYGSKNFPAWIKNIALPQTFALSKKPDLGTLGMKKNPTNIRNWQIEISSPERAILELLYEVEKEGTSFQFVAEIFENLTTLSPRLLNQLLEKCDSLKVKRLFLFLANYYAFSWWKHIDTDVLDIGVGKMQVVKNGAYDKTYKITVPREFI